MPPLSDTPGRQVSKSGVDPGNERRVPGQAEVLAQLERILDHPVIQASKRLSAFLRFVVETTLAGRSEELKEYVIGIEVFERPRSYSPQEDPVVRVMAGRLRAKLAEYYHASGNFDSLVIELPKGGYTPRFAWRTVFGLSPVHLVGRQEELERLRAAFSTASGGRGGMCTVSGEAGVGKTALAEHFLSEMEAAFSSIWIGRGRCSEFGGETSALAPIFEALDTLVRSESGDQVAELLKARAPSWYIHLSSVVSESGGLNTAEIGQHSHERTLRELLVFLQEISRIRPVILFLDDLHWSDPSTCDLLAYLGPRLRSSCILILATYRVTALRARRHSFLKVKLGLESAGICQELPLSLLTLTETELYVARQFPTNLFPNEFAALIHRRTEGNPFFITAMLKYLRDTHILVQERDGGYQLERPISDIEKLIPGSIRNLIQLTVDQLDPAERQILRCAAALGMQFDSAVIAEVLSTSSIHVEERLQELEASRDLVNFATEHEFPDGTVSVRYRFVHVFYQNVVRASLGPSQRAALCAAGAKAWARFSGTRSREIAIDLALLFESGREYGSASKHFLEGAQNAVKIFAYQEAGQICERGLRALARLPASRERDLLELDLSLIFVMAARHIRGYGASEVKIINSRCRELCLRLNDDRRLLSVLSLIQAGELNTGELTRALDLSRELQVVAQRSADPGPRIAALQNLGWTFAFMGRLSEARQLIESAGATEQISFDGSMSALHPRAISAALLGRVLALMGYFDQAIQTTSTAIEDARSLHQLPTVAYGSFWMGYIHNAYAEHDQSYRYLDQGVTLSREYGLVQLAAGASVVRGAVMAQLGRTTEGIGEMRSALDRQHRLGMLVERPYFLTLLAEALVEAGGLDEALALCDQAVELARRTEARCYEPETHRVRGECLLALSKRSRLAEAEAEFKLAIELAKSAESRLLELRAGLSYFCLCRRFGDASVGHAILSRILNSFTEGFNSRIVRAALGALKDQKLSRLDGFGILREPELSPRATHAPGSPHRRRR